jgi:hypothetical protein
VRTADHRRKADTSSESASFTCQHYTPRPGNKRCKDYQEGGTCARPDQFLCSEWEKRNLTPAVPTDLFGDPAPELIQPRREATVTKPKSTKATEQSFVVNEPIPEREPLRGLTTDDIDGFKALGVEVCLESDSFGEMWLVPAYTGADRKEITPEHTATIVRVMEAFPGSTVVSFEKSPQQGKEAIQ